jgi:hypothetical protein
VPLAEGTADTEADAEAVRLTPEALLVEERDADEDLEDLDEADAVPEGEADPERWWSG